MHLKTRGLERKGRCRQEVFLTPIISPPAPTVKARWGWASWLGAKEPGSQGGQQ